MASQTPLNQQSLPAPEPGRDRPMLHWGAAIGALVLAAAMAGSVVALFLQGDSILDDWLREDAAREVAYRFGATAVLVAAAAVVVTAVFVLADTAHRRVLSWVAMAVAVLAGLSVAPWWWELAGGYRSFWFPLGTTLLVAVWLYPAAFVEDGFPQSAKTLMVSLSLLSLLPTAVVWGWAALGRDAGHE